MLRSILLASTCFLPLLCAPAHAVTFTSGANAASTNISIAGGVVAADASVAPVSGSGAPAYDRTGGVASVNQNFTLTSGIPGTATQGLTTGVVTTRASSAAPTQTSAMATVTLNNVNSVLASKLLSDLVPVAALGLTADQISSTTVAGLDANGDIFGTQSSSFANLGLTGSALGLLTVNGSLYSNPTANTVLLSLAGLTVTLNQQIRTATATGTLFETNAVHIALNNYSLAGKLLTGSVTLGHSQAEVSGVPEPGTWATMLLGFGAVGFAMRGRRRPMAAFA